MNINKLAPWNWFKQEDELQRATVPVKREDISHDPWHTMEQMHRELDRLFNDAFQGFSFAPLRRSLLPATPSDGGGWLTPRVDISSTDTEYTINVELPGVTEEDVHVELLGDTLRIQGEKKQESENKGRDYYSVERSYGSFQRVLSLPEDADSDAGSASFKNGVLRVTIPRKETAAVTGKRIPIQTG